MTKETKDKQPSLGCIALDWWNGLQADGGKGTRRGGDLGALARLRRADLLDAAMEEATIDLFHRLKSHPQGAFLGERLVERTALIAAVLAHVREDDERKVKVAAAAGETTGGGQRILHPLRLRRLFAAREPRDCLVAFRRLVAILRKKANVADLAESLFDWPDEWRGDHQRKRWAFAYYGGSSATLEEHEQAA
jgi:CRISPR system Cascade subunit CasB